MPKSNSHRIKHVFRKRAIKKFSDLADAVDTIYEACMRGTQLYESFDNAFDPGNIQSYIYEAQHMPDVSPELDKRLVDLQQEVTDMNVNLKKQLSTVLKAIENKAKQISEMV